MFKKIMWLALAFLALASVPALAADNVPFTQLMQNPLFANATPEIRLQMLNQKMAADELDVSSDLTVRLFWDVIVDEPDPLVRLQRFDTLESTYDEFWASSDTVAYLLMEYLAASEYAASKDYLAMMKMVRDLEEAGTVSSGDLSWLMDGFLALHLVTNAEYQAMSLSEKQLYLKTVGEQGFWTANTAMDFALGLASETLSLTPPEEQQGMLATMEPDLVGFVYSALSDGYGDLTDNVAMQDPDVQAAVTAEEKLAVINAKIDAEEMSSSDLGHNVCSRLLWDVIAPIHDPVARLAKYKELREVYRDLPITTEIEYTLALDVIAAEPVAASSDVLGIMIRIQEMEDEDAISWHAVAPLHYGMMAMLMATSQEYQAMADLDKLAYLVNFDPQNWASSLTSSEYSEQLACEMLSGAAEADRPALLEQVLATADFFTKSVVEGGYVE